MRSRKIGLFQYMLRNSFWRPRDIIKYFAVLYDANLKSNKKGGSIDNDTLKALLSKVTDDIITSEFYNEYDKVIYNIEDILDQFRYSEIVLTSEKVIQIIKSFKFEGAVFRQDLVLIDKIEMLYEIGVLGLIFSDEYAKEKNINASLCFAFNEGMYPFSIVKETLLKEQDRLLFVINPIFQKKYSLKFNSPKVIGDFSWEYLMKNHVRKSVIDRP